MQADSTLRYCAGWARLWSGWYTHAWAVDENDEAVESTWPGEAQVYFGALVEPAPSVADVKED